MQAARSSASSVREGGGASSESRGGEEGWGGEGRQVLGLHQKVRRLCQAGHSGHRVHIWLRSKTFDGFETTLTGRHEYSGIWGLIMGVKLLRYLPQSPDEQSRRTSERCEQRREEV